MGDGLMHTWLVGHLLLPWHERLKGKSTFTWLSRLERTQWLSPEQLAELQWSRLRESLQFAYDHVPYYRRLLDEHELTPPRVQSPADFARIPPLTRQAIRANFDDLRARGRLRGVRKCSSGGSTGAPVTILTDMDQMGFTEAVRLRAHRWFDVQSGAREVCLWGSPIELTKQDRLRSLRDWLLNSRVLSAFDMDASRLAAYARFITRFRPEKLYCYAHAAYLFARYAARVAWTPPSSLRAVFTTAETLFDFQRQAIRDALGVPVAVEYGARDAGLMATECPKGSLHIPAEGMHIEIDRAGSDGLGEIVATNLYSAAMPIIRYRTGDLGEVGSRPCPCGRGLPSFKRLEGRSGDFLVTPAGRILHGQSIVHALRTMTTIDEFQVVQEAVDRVVISVVPSAGFSESDRQFLIDRARLLLGPHAAIAVETMQVIPRLSSGKFRHVISHVADTYLDRIMAGSGPRASSPATSSVDGAARS